MAVQAQGAWDVWAEHAVFLHPSAYAKDNVEGVLYLATDTAPPTRSSLSLGFRAETDAFVYPLLSLHSVRLQPPSSVRVHGSVVVHTHTDKTPSLFFHQHAYGAEEASWGGYQLLAVLRKYAEVLASRQEQGLYLVNPDRDARSVHTTPLFDNDLVHATRAPPTPTTFSQWAHGKQLSVLTRFSHVTRSARQSSEALLSHPLIKRAVLPQTTASHAGPYMVSEQSGRAQEPEEFDAARVYLAKWAQHIAQEGERSRAAEESEPTDVEALLGTTPIPSSSETRSLRTAPPVDTAAWDALLEQGTSATVLAQHVFHRGVCPHTRAEVWPYLFGALPPAPPSERGRALEKKEEEYTLWLAKWQAPDTVLPDEVAASKHRIWIDCLRADTKHPFLEQEEEGAPERAYAAMLQSGWERLPQQGSASGHVSAHLYVLSDVLMTFCLYAHDPPSPTLAAIDGYVQGMSDLCLVCYVACDGNPARTFWCFVGVMQRFGPNFAQDQSGMRRELLTLQRLLGEMDPGLYTFLQNLDGLNLFFCFRWILVCFKREFVMEDVLCLWDALFSASWSDSDDAFGVRQWPLCHDFELFIALAILETHAEVMMRHLRSFDELLQYIHSLAYQMDVHAILRRAEALVYRLRGRAQRADPALDASVRALVLQDTVQ